MGKITVAVLFKDHRWEQKTLIIPIDTDDTSECWEECEEYVRQEVTGLYEEREPNCVKVVLLDVQEV